MLRQPLRRIPRQTLRNMRRQADKVCYDPGQIDIRRSRGSGIQADVPTTFGRRSTFELRLINWERS